MDVFFGHVLVLRNFDGEKINRALWDFELAFESGYLRYHHFHDARESQPLLLCGKK